MDKPNVVPFILQRSGMYYTSFLLAGISMLTTIPRAVSSQPAEIAGHPGFARDCETADFNLLR